MNWDFFLEKGRKFCNPPKKGGGMRNIIASRASFSLYHFIVMCLITRQQPGAWGEQAPAASKQRELVQNTCSDEARSHPSMLF